MQKHALEQLAATLLLLLAAAPNTHSEEELPECEAGESPYMNKEKAPIQNMHQAAPQSDNRKAYAELPASITTLTQEDFSFGEQIAQLSLGGGEPERPWIVDFYTTSRTDVKKRLSEDDELSFLAAAELAKGICGFAVCNLNEAVKGRARAFPAYPATFAYAQTNMFRGRMFASPWKGNRTIRALVETCLDHAKQELAPELLAKLEAAEVSGHLASGLHSSKSPSNIVADRRPTRRSRRCGRRSRPRRTRSSRSARKRRGRPAKKPRRSTRRRRAKSTSSGPGARRPSTRWCSSRPSSRW